MNSLILRLLTFCFLIILIPEKGLCNHYSDSIQKVINSSNGKVKIEAIIDLSNFYIEQDNVPKATELVNQAMNLSKEQNYKNGICAAHLFFTLYGDEKKSAENFKKGIDLAFEIQEPSLLKRAVGVLREYYSNTGDKQELVYLEKALSISKNIKNDKLTASIYQNTGYYYYSISDFNKSITAFKNALYYYNKSNKLSQSAGMTMNIGIMFYKTGHLDSSLVYYKKAQSIFDKLGDVKNGASAITNVALTLEELGKNKEALELMQGAIIKYKKSKDSSLLAGSYEIAAIMYDNLEMEKEHMDYLIQCTNIRERLNDPELSNSYMNLGSAYFDLKNYSRAQTYIRKAIALEEKAGNKDKLAHSYSNLSSVLKEINKLDSSIYYEEKSLSLRNEIGALADASKSCHSLGNLYKQKGNDQKAFELYLKAVQLAEESKSYSKLPEFLNTLGLEYIQKKDYRKAIEYFRKSEFYLKETDNPNQKLTMLDYISQAYGLSGQTNEAYQYLKKWKSLSDSLKSAEQEKVNAELLEKYETDKKEKEITILKKDQELKDLIVEKQNEDINRQRKVTIAILSGLLVLAGFAFFLFKSNRERKKANQIITQQKQEVEKQKDLIEEKNNEILDSIHYAKKIQQTLLSNQNLIQTNFSKHFIIFKPKDLVSGDFYWSTSVTSSLQQVSASEQITNNKKHENVELLYLAVCDSTGHGVPGAFMSLLNISFLNEAINEKKIYEPHLIFNYVRQKLIDNISQDGGQDGMDAVLLCINKKTGKASYAAAHNAPLITRNGKLIQLETDKMPIGKGIKDTSFRCMEVDLQPGDRIFLFTDGYADQFGGPKGKKFKHKNLGILLTQTGSLPIEEQKEELIKTFDNWKGDLEQIDDVCLMGIEIQHI